MRHARTSNARRGLGLPVLAALAVLAAATGVGWYVRAIRSAPPLAGGTGVAPSRSERAPLIASHVGEPICAKRHEALATFEAKRNEWSAAIGWDQNLVNLRPEDTEARALLAQIERRAGRGGGRRP